MAHANWIVQVPRMRRFADSDSDSTPTPTATPTDADTYANPNPHQAPAAPSSLTANGFQPIKSI